MPREALRDLRYYESGLWVSNLVYALVRLNAILTESQVRVLPKCFFRATAAQAQGIALRAANGVSAPVHARREEADWL